MSDDKKKKVGTTNWTGDLKGTMNHVTGVDTVMGTAVDHARPDLRAKKEPPK